MRRNNILGMDANVAQTVNLFWNELIWCGTLPVMSSDKLSLAKYVPCIRLLPPSHLLWFSHVALSLEDGGNALVA